MTDQTATPEPEAEDVNHTLIVNTNSIDMGKPLGLSLGDVVTLTIQATVTSVAERAPYSAYDRRTVTTTVDAHSIGMIHSGRMTTNPVRRARRSRWAWLTGR